MDHISTYALFGIPDGVATAFVLIALSLALAPWFEGVEIGPLKIPVLRENQTKLLRALMPLILITSIGLFFPYWAKDDAGRAPSELNEIALRWLETELGTTVWDGGEEWGEVVFQETGRDARYENAAGRSPGSIQILGGDFGGSGFILFTGVWSQDDGREGEFELVAGYGDELQVRWGPDNSLHNDWVRLIDDGSQGVERAEPILRWAALEEEAQPFGPVFVDSLRVQASGTGGQTAHRVIQVSAGEGRAFLPDSLEFIEASRSGGGHVEARFLEERFEFVDLDVVVGGELAQEVVTISMPQVIYISLYAETGSGLENINRGAWLNGNVTARTIEVPE